MIVNITDAALVKKAQTGNKDDTEFVHFISAMVYESTKVSDFAVQEPGRTATAGSTTRSGILSAAPCVTWSGRRRIAPSVPSTSRKRSSRYCLMMARTCRWAEGRSGGRFPSGSGERRRLAASNRREVISTRLCAMSTSMLDPPMAPTLISARGYGAGPRGSGPGPVSLQDNHRRYLRPGRRFSSR